MDFLWNGLREAVLLVARGDPQVLSATLRTLVVSTTAVLLATLVGLPIGVVLARSVFRGRSGVLLLVRTAMAVPTVFLGIVCYGLFSRQGPLGPFDLLYTPWVIIIGETLLALPIIAALSHGAIASLDPRVDETARVLGAGLLRRFWTCLSEARTGVVLAVLTAFARCSTELGIAMMVGADIKHRTRTLATATAREIGQGEFERGLAMGSLLLVIALGFTVIVGWLGREGDRSR